MIWINQISTVIGLCFANKVSVIGVSGNVPSKGINKGNVVDIDSAVEAISQSVEKAERMAGISVSNAFVTINGSHIETLNSHGVVAVAPNENADITREDVARVIEALKLFLYLNKEIIHVIPRDFVVNSRNELKILLECQVLD